MTRRTPTERLRHAEQMAEHWQYLGNRASERGDSATAERHYSRSQKWRDEMNDLLGNGDANVNTLGG